MILNLIQSLIDFVQNPFGIADAFRTLAKGQMTPAARFNLIADIIICFVSVVYGVFVFKNESVWFKFSSMIVAIAVISGCVVLTTVESRNRKSQNRKGSRGKKISKSS